MEETVWIYFGVVAAILAIGIVATVIVEYQKDNKEDVLLQSLGQLRQESDLVCDAPPQTLLSVSVTMPAGALLYATGDRLCASLDGNPHCVPTKCTVAPGTILNLTDAAGLFDTHGYTCAFLNQADAGSVALNITCLG